MKRLAFAVILFLVAASPLAAVDLGPVAGDRIAILAVPRDDGRRMNDDLSDLIARVTARRLEKEGFATVVLPRSVDEFVEDGLREAVDASGSSRSNGATAAPTPGERAGRRARSATGSSEAMSRS